MSTTVENKTSVSAADKTEVDAPHEGSGFIAVNKSTLSKAAEAGTPKDEVIKAVPSEDLEDVSSELPCDISRSHIFHAPLVFSHFESCTFTSLNPRSPRWHSQIRNNSLTEPQCASSSTLS